MKKLSALIFVIGLGFKAGTQSFGQCVRRIAK